MVKSVMMNHNYELLVPSFLSNKHFSSNPANVTCRSMLTANIVSCEERSNTINFNVVALLI
jgi:hypothetical protein